MPAQVLHNYGQRLVRLAEETESAMRELRDLQRGRVLIGANEAAVHTLLPLIARFRERFPDIAIDVRRVPARQIAVEVQQGSLDFGALTFHPTEAGLLEMPVGSDELVLLVPSRARRWRSRRQVTMEELASEPVVAHNDPSPARERVLRLFEQRHIALKMVISLPSLDGIKRAVELKLGVALLPRRCAITEIASGRLVAVPVAGVSRRRQVTLVCRRAHRSHASDAFLDVAQEKRGPIYNLEIPPSHHLSVAPFQLLAQHLEVAARRRADQPQRQSARGRPSPGRRPEAGSPPGHRR